MPLCKRPSLRKVSSEGGTEKRHPNRTGPSPRVAWECWPGFTRATTGGEQPKAGQCSGHTFLNPVTQGPKQVGFRPPPSLKRPAPRPRPARSSGHSRSRHSRSCRAVRANGPAGTHMPQITNKRPLQRWRTDTKRPCIQIRQLEQAVDGTGRAGWEECAGDMEAQRKLCPARRHHRFSFSSAPFTKTPEPSRRLPCKGRESQRASDVHLFCVSDCSTKSLSPFACVPGAQVPLGLWPPPPAPSLGSARLRATSHPAEKSQGCGCRPCPAGGMP